LPFDDADEETLVRRGARRNGADSERKNAPPAPGVLPSAEPLRRDRPVRSTSPEMRPAENHRKRLPVALLAGLLAVVLAGLAIAYLTSRKSASPDKSAAPQENARVGMTNANANGNVALPANSTPAGAPANPSTPTAAPRTDDAHAVGSSAPNRNEDSTPAPTANAGKAVNEVRNAVSAWNATLQARNLNAHMAYYAPRLHTYFLKENVDRDAARAEVAAALSRYSKLKIHTSPLAVSVDPSGSHAVVTYEKNWDFEGKEPWSGAAVERLWLERINGRWRITGVRDLKQIR
jgi:ketosteroid isomerase-like protein